MLSAESAAGEFPIEAVSTMDKIAQQVEQDPNYRTIIYAQRTEPEATGADAISAAAGRLPNTEPCCCRLLHDVWRNGPARLS